MQGDTRLTSQHSEPYNSLCENPSIPSLGAQPSVKENCTASGQTYRARWLPCIWSNPFTLAVLHPLRWRVVQRCVLLLQPPEQGGAVVWHAVPVNSALPALLSSDSPLLSPELMSLFGYCLHLFMPLLHLGGLAALLSSLCFCRFSISTFPHLPVSYLFLLVPSLAPCNSSVSLHFCLHFPVPLYICLFFPFFFSESLSLPSL